MKGSPPVGDGVVSHATRSVLPSGNSESGDLDLLCIAVTEPRISGGSPAVDVISGNSSRLSAGNDRKRSDYRPLGFLTTSAASGGISPWKSEPAL